MADPTIPRSGLIRGNCVLEFLKSYLGDKTFKDLNTPFSCVATDIQTGKEIVMDEGNVAEAVRASLSLPFFFQPYYLNGRYLVDGGLVNPVPSSIVLAQGANIVISANLTSKAGERRVPRLLGWRKRLPHLLKGPSITEIMMKTIYIMQYEIAAARSELAHVVLEMKSHNYLWWDLDKAKDIIRVGEMIAEENMPKIKSLLPFHADSCRVKLVPRNPKTF
jgi:NTE family protein